MQTHIQNPVKLLIAVNFLKLFVQNSPSYMFDRVLNTTVKCLRLWSRGSTNLGLLIFSWEDSAEDSAGKLTLVNSFVNEFSFQML